MAIDASIYRGIEPPKPVNLLAQYGDVMNLQGAQQQQRMNALKFDEYERGVQSQNKLKTLLAGTPEDQLEGTLMRGGFLKEASDFGKARVERQKTGVEIKAKEAEIADKTFTTAKNRYGLFRGELAALAMDPQLSRDKVLAVGQALVDQGILPLEMFQKASANLPEDPQQLRDKLMGTVRAQLSPEQLLTAFAPKPTEFSDGQTKGFKDTNPNSPTYGQMTAGAPVQMQQTPDNVATNTRMSNDAAARREQSERQHRETMELRRDIAAAKGAGAAAKPMPAAALRLQQDEIDAVSGAAGIDADLGAVAKQLEDGKLQLGPIRNALNQGRNLAGFSNEQSRNLQTLKSTLERLRNESLRLNKGVQTDGDSQRAWNELLTNINDAEVVKQRLAEIRALNRRAVRLRSMNIQTIRSNYGQPELDLTGRDDVAPTLGDGAKPPTEDDPLGLRR